MELDWRRCRNRNGVGAHWCSFSNLNLDSVKPCKGVYVIWFAPDCAPVVRVGQGDVAKRISKHRDDDEVTCYDDVDEPLLVTWASVPKAKRNGVERYLADQLQPTVGERFPDVDPIEVNLPF